MSTFQVYKFTDDIRDGRYLTANSDGSMRWTLTRGDAHKLSRKEADTMAAWVRKVFIGHMAIVVPEGKSPWEVLRAKPRGTKLNPATRKPRVGDYVKANHPRGGHIMGRIVKRETTGSVARAYGPRFTLDTGYSIGVGDVIEIMDGGKAVKKNPRKRRASPAQLAARAKFTAMVKSGRKFGRKAAKVARKVGRKSVAAAKAFRKTNPRSTAFQVATAKGKLSCTSPGSGFRATEPRRRISARFRLRAKSRSKSGT
jgi:hypothetical protein